MRVRAKFKNALPGTASTTPNARHTDWLCISAAKHSIASKEILHTLRSAHRNVKPGSGEAGSALNLSIRTPKNQESITAPLSFSARIQL
ncbi:hypothetical protein HYQ46_001747 [Verticillium longisporum]|nr:hypothetical protein HYQ46_001747 [Verticillium longisporum]